MKFVSWNRDKLTLCDGDDSNDPEQCTAYKVDVNHEVLRDGLPALSTDLRTTDDVTVTMRDQGGHEGLVARVEATSNPA
jgi:hypothetical protein